MQIGVCSGGVFPTGKTIPPDKIYPGYGLAFVNSSQTVPCIWFAFDLRNPNHTLGTVLLRFTKPNHTLVNVSIEYGMAAAPYVQSGKYRQIMSL